jgi:polyisoprenoid-binding protein YceI
VRRPARRCTAVSYPQPVARDQTARLAAAQENKSVIQEGFIMLKKIVNIAAAVTLAATSVAALAEPAQPGQYQIDATHTLASFEVGHLGFSKLDGRFNKIAGSYTVDAKGNGTVNVEIPVASIDTNHAERDKHMKSPDFFNAVQFPTIKFEGKKENTQLKGNLTLHGVTRPVTFNVETIGAGKDPWGGYRSGFQATTVIKRSDFGMKFMLGGIPDEVAIKVNVEGIKQ